MYEDNKYIVTIPETREQLCDEATQQSNCVAGYFNRMLEGECTIVFLRQAKYPELSWVTIEVRNNVIVQAKMRYNSNLNAEAKAAMTKYAEANGLEIGCYY